MEQLLRAIAPNCSQFILNCKIGKAFFNGFDCCAKYFDPTPIFTDGGKFVFIKVKILWIVYGLLSWMQKVISSYMSQGMQKSGISGNAQAI